MKRQDQAVYTHYEQDRGMGYSDLEVTSQLNGNRREVDIIMRGLRALKGQMLLEEATGKLADDSKTEQIIKDENADPTITEVTLLLEQLGEKKVLEPLTVRTSLEHQR